MVRPDLCLKCKGRNIIKECSCGCQNIIFMFSYNNDTEKFYIKGHTKERNRGFCMVHGYKYIRNPNHHFSDRHGYVLEHRLNWEEFHKASLLPWADVHHLDHDKLNNNPLNLVAMMN